MQIVHYDSEQARLYIRVSGFWSMENAVAHHDAVAVACQAAAAAGRAISVLSDTTGYQPQSGAVGEIQEKLPLLFANVTVAQIAVVAPSALVRMGTRRRMQGVDHEVFEDVGAALAWLGWAPDYIGDCEKTVRRAA